MNSSMGSLTSILAVAGIFLLSEGTGQSIEDTLKSRSVKMSEDWPFLVFAYSVRRGKTETCDAVVYNEKWVLISPTCPNKRDTQFYYGVGNKWCDSGDISFPYAQGVQVRQLKRRISGTQDDFDFPWWVLQLVEVSSPVTFNGRVQPAKLADRAPFEGEQFDSIGWVRKPTVPDCHERHKVTVSRASDAKCNETWGIEEDLEDMICFEPQRDGKTYSQFENNGAPLVKDGMVYGFMLHFSKDYQESDPSDFKLSMAVPMSKFYDWSKFVTNERWYSNLDDLLPDSDTCI